MTILLFTVLSIALLVVSVSLCIVLNERNALQIEIKSYKKDLGRILQEYAGSLDKVAILLNEEREIKKHNVQTLQEKYSLKRL